MNNKKYDKKIYKYVANARLSKITLTKSSSFYPKKIKIMSAEREWVERETVGGRELGAEVRWEG